VEERLPRKLAVILHADVVGYSRLAGDDEDDTHRRLKESLGLIANLVSDYHGRIVNTVGDALLAMFEAVVDAVSCAVAIQDDLAARNQSIPDNRKVLFRIGVNLGDVIEDGGDIYGDGVNVAARLQTLAEAGGICISSIVHESLGNRVDAEFADAGEHEFKNIARKIRVYRWPAQKAAVASMEPMIPTELKQNHTISIAKFENLSSDPELGYFCEGIVEDISAALGDIAQLTVISNHQSNGGVKASSGYQEAALYILKGTIRKAGDRLRISAQLVERQSGVQRWADRFNHDTTDIFQVQDDVMRRIVIGIHTELGAGAYTNQWQWGTESLEAWQLMAKGFREFQRQSPDSMIKTISFWEHALEIDPEYLAPVMGTGYCYSYMALVSDKDTAQLYIEKAQAAFDRSVTEAPNDVRTYSAKRELEIARGNYDAAVR
jgi:adenylate cyclase